MLKSGWAKKVGVSAEFAPKKVQGIPHVGDLGAGDFLEWPEFICWAGATIAQDGDNRIHRRIYIHLIDLTQKIREKGWGGQQRVPIFMFCSSFVVLRHLQLGLLACEQASKYFQRETAESTC